MPGGAPDVFISYKREDRARVRELAGILADLNLDVWYDIALRAGEPWSARIDLIARNAGCIVACWTRAASTSPWVQREIEIGLEGGVLVLARFDDHPLSPALGRLHCADLSRWQQDLDDPNLRQLIDGIDRHVEAPVGGRFAERIDGQNPVAIDLLRRLLIRAAQQSTTITYREAFDAVCHAYLKGKHATWPTLFATLDAIADDNRLAREPPLFGLVVNGETGLPGKGYFQKHCFLASEHSPLARDLHDAHLQRIFEYDWSEET
jgi:hypothetical protein